MNVTRSLIYVPWLFSAHDGSLFDSQVACTHYMILQLNNSLGLNASFLTWSRLFGPDNNYIMRTVLHCSTYLFQLHLVGNNPTEVYLNRTGYGILIWCWSRNLCLNVSEVWDTWDYFCLRNLSFKMLFRIWLHFPRGQFQHLPGDGVKNQCRDTMSIMIFLPLASAHQEKVVFFWPLFSKYYSICQIIGSHRCIVSIIYMQLHCITPVGLYHVATWHSEVKFHSPSEPGTWIHFPMWSRDWWR